MEVIIHDIKYVIKQIEAKDSRLLFITSDVANTLDLISGTINETKINIDKVIVSDDSEKSSIIIANKFHTDFILDFLSKNNGSNYAILFSYEMNADDNLQFMNLIGDPDKFPIFTSLVSGSLTGKTIYWCMLIIKEKKLDLMRICLDNDQLKAVQ